MSDEEEDPLKDDPELQRVWTTTTLRGECPKCEKVNYVDLGDLEDMTAPDVEIVECWNCGTKSWIDKSVSRDYGYESMDEGYEEKGKETP